MFVDAEALAEEVRRHAPFRLKNGYCVDAERIIREYLCYTLERRANFVHEGRKLLGACFFEDDHIVVESIGYWPRINFTLAHELGHGLIDYRLNDNRRIVSFRDCDEVAVVEKDATLKAPDRRSTRPIEEVMANKFASALLMPAQEIIAASRAKHPSRSLAAMYGVSPKAFQHRLETLGLAAPPMA